MVPEKGSWGRPISSGMTAPLCEQCHPHQHLLHHQRAPSASKLGLVPLTHPAQADPWVCVPQSPCARTEHPGTHSCTSARGGTALCKRGACCRSSERPHGQAQSQGEPSWGWMGLPGRAGEGVGGHEHGQRLGRATGCMTELAWQEFILQSKSRALQTIKMTAKVQKIIINTCSGKLNLPNLVCLICLTTKSLFYFVFLRFINTFSF